MHISDAGLGIIKEFEGYVQALPNGDCVAYRCVVGRRNGQPIYDGKWTIGWGCTEGISQGMVWTRDQAEDGLRREVEKAERNVTRCVTVPINQNQFDALVSFDYNCGDGALASSSILRRFNAGDVQGAASAFSMWTGSNGVKNVPGLVRRRAMESGLFLKPAEESHEALQDAGMPQTVDAPVSSEEHADAHTYLEQASTLYARHGSAIRLTGWSLPPGIAAIWQWASQPLHAALLLAGVAFALILVLELSRLKQRSSVIGRTP